MKKHGLLALVLGGVIAALIFLVTETLYHKYISKD